MDIDYLLLLQDFREATNNFFSPFLLWVSNFAIGIWPFIFVSIIYWVFDRKGGKRILFGMALGAYLNEFLKLSFKIPRPWIRNSKILPYGNSKIISTGFSFPSGHSTMATSGMGGIAVWSRKRNLILTVVSALFVFLTMFSRNYLGVHTPQDVIAGFVIGCLMLFAADRIENWVGKNSKRDLIVLCGGLFLCLCGWLFVNNIHIAPIYDETGRMIIDPVKMSSDSYIGLGIFSSFVICSYFEKRLFFFDKEKSFYFRLITGLIAAIPLYFWGSNIAELIVKYNRPLGKFLFCFVMNVYTMIIVPFIMSIIKKK